MRILTIGFTKKSAEKFFGLLVQAEAKRVVDVRLNNASQLSGFAKRDDLRFLLNKIGNIDYVHLPELAPTQEMLDDYRKGHKDWNKYTKDFLDLMAERKIESTIQPETLEEGCLLCSEDKPHQCHRSLVVQYLSDHWGNLEVQHLM